MSDSRIPWAEIFGRLEDFLAAEDPPSVNRVADEDRDPFRVVVSTIISARTKDEVTLAAAGRLLARAGSPAELAALEEQEIARRIYPAGFYRAKAVHLKRMAAALLERHAGRVPREMDELMRLPGVGRKTANLVLNLAFGLEGICVDTHVHRISNRLGWVATGTPSRTEAGLSAILPRRYWIPINSLLVRFGRLICTPVSPRCSECPLRSFCPRTGVQRSR